MFWHVSAGLFRHSQFLFAAILPPPLPASINVSAKDRICGQISRHWLEWNWNIFWMMEKRKDRQAAQTQLFKTSVMRCSEHSYFLADIEEIEIQWNLLAISGLWTRFGRISKQRLLQRILRLLSSACCQQCQDYLQTGQLIFWCHPLTVYMIFWWLVLLTENPVKTRLSPCSETQRW